MPQWLSKEHVRPKNQKFMRGPGSIPTGDTFYNWILFVFMTVNDENCHYWHFRLFVKNSTELTWHVLVGIFELVMFMHYLTFST